jgi:hypothetical protein
VGSDVPTFSLSKT